MNTTPAQNFLVYKSSAGSGKTYTLVKEYLKIALVNPQRIRNILAITFTNAAAAEMKHRIISTLGQLVRVTGDQEAPIEALLEALEKETNLTRSEILMNARSALSLILHNYADFGVSTIDSFAHRIIRSFAFDLHLPLNFDVELDQDQLLGQAIDLLVSRVGNDADLTKMLVHYIETRTDEEKGHHIERDIARLACTLMDEKGTRYVNRLKGLSLADFGQIHRKLTTSIKTFELNVQDIAVEACRHISSRGLNTEMFYRGKTGIANWFANLANGNIDKITPNSYVITTVTENKWSATKADKTTQAAIEEIKPLLNDCYNRIIELTQRSQHKVHRLVRKNLYPMAVLCELEKVMDEIKSEHSLLHISDFNKKISEIVAVESAPFIYERIGERYNHYMIDEFQDTSGLQWQNLLPLIDNSLASGNVNLVVGDGKQAIYRWRNGDVEQFAALPHLMDSIGAQARDQWQQTLIRNYKALPLDANWRSLPEIIEFNNRFFEFIKQLLPAGLAAIYEGHQQQKHPEKKGGYVQIDYIEESKGENDYVEDTHTRINKIISDLRSDGYPLSKITVLCRSNKEASAVARYLLKEGISVVSSESLLLNQSPEVNFMLSVMKLINHAGDQVSLVELVGYLYKSNRVDGDIHQILKRLLDHPLAASTHLPLEQYLSENGMVFSFNHCRHLGLYELGEHIIRCFFHHPDPFITFFMDVIYEYSNRNISSLSDFLEWWDEHSAKYSVVVPEGIDAVQVMTIHKSKGLQFAVVICPFTDKDYSRLGKEGEWVELEDMEETSPLQVAWLNITSAMESTPYEDLWNMEKGKTMLDTFNIAYVAFTRAISKLFILTKYPQSGKFNRNLAAILQQFLEGEGLWNASERTFCFGEKASELTDSGTTDSLSQSTLKQYISIPWAQRITVRSKQLEAHPGKESGVERGSRMHEIMEKIHTPTDIGKALQQLYLSGHLDKEEQSKLHQRITQILSHPAISDYYTLGIRGRNECGMYDRMGRFFRADRVIIKDGSAVIIDYKTGTPKPDHEMQINRYSEILQDMGYREIRKYLVYLDQNAVLEV